MGSRNWSRRARRGAVAAVLVAFYGGGAFALSASGAPGGGGDDGDTVTTTTSTKTLTDTTQTTTETKTTETVTTITDTGKPPAISISDASIVEGDSGTQELVFTVKRVGLPIGDIFAGYSTVDASATSPDDYAAQSGQVVIPQKQDTATIKITIVGDKLVEGDHDFRVVLQTPKGGSNYVLGDGEATGTIIDDDRPTGSTSCRASAIRALGLEPIVANAPDDPCAAATHSLLRTRSLAGFLGSLGNVTADALDAGTAVTASGGQAHADVADVNISLLGISIKAQALAADATVSCTGGKTTLQAHTGIASLQINGRTIAIGNDPLTIPLPGLGAVRIGTVTKSDEVITARALEVDLPGTALDVVVSEAIADRHGSC